MAVFVNRGSFLQESLQEVPWYLGSTSFIFGPLSFGISHIGVIWATVSIMDSRVILTY